MFGCNKWKCRFFGHKWLQDNITYRVFYSEPQVFQLWCLRYGGFTTVSKDVFNEYLSEEFNKELKMEASRQDEVNEIIFVPE